MTRLALGTLFLVACALVTPRATFAQAAPATKPAAALAPFVDESTLGVVRVDVAKLEWPAAAAWANKLLGGAGLSDADLKQSVAAVNDGTTRAKQWADAWLAAGGGEVYLVVNLDELSPAYGIVPLRPGADADKLTEMIKQIGLANGINPFAELTGAVTVERVGDVLVSGPPHAVKMAKKIAADPDRVARDDLPVALAAGGDGAAVRVAFCPPLHVKRALAVNNPELPKELGGGPTGQVTDAFGWAVLSIAAPTAASPTASFRMTVQASDAAGAQRLMRVATAAIASARKEIEDVKAPGVEQLAARLTPKVVGDRVELTFDQPAMEEAAKTVASIALEARSRAKQTQSMSNVRQIALAVVMYTNDHKGKLPDKLPDDVRPYLGEGPAGQAMFVNPRWPDRRPGYVYVKPGGRLQDVRDLTSAVIVYESHDAWPAGGIAVGFADGHAEMIASETDFKKMLERK